MPENQNKAPTIDPKAWQRNKTTAWLEFIDRLSSWLWQDNEGAARWTLVLDDAERHSSTTHPPRTDVLEGVGPVEQQDKRLSARVRDRRRVLARAGHLCRERHGPGL